MNRIERLRKKLKLSKSEAIIIKSCVNRFYFTGFRSSDGYIVITNEDAYLFVDFRYIEKATSDVKNLEVVEFNNIKDTLLEVIKRHKIMQVYLENSYISLADAQFFEEILSGCGSNVMLNKKLDDAIISLRQIKTEIEVKKIKEAQRLTDLTYEHILNTIAIDDTERDIALRIEMFMRKNGASGVSFDTICLFGKNTSMPHGTPGDNKLQKGDLVTIDMGAVVDGFCSDMTRTFAIGKIDSKTKDVYDIVLKAQKKAIEQIKPQKICKDIDFVARSLIYSSGYEGCFGHGTGHSVGIEIHEKPCFSKSDDTKLLPGMVMTVEPGIYIENEFGIRIEDMVIVTENGFENITNSKKELVIV